MNGWPEGVGLGWRPETALWVERWTGSFTEVVAESIDPERIPQALLDLVERGISVLPHGVSLSLGSAEPLDEARARRLARLAARLSSPLVSEHVSFCRAGGVEIGHLTPVPMTRASIRALVDNVKRLQDWVGLPVALENIAGLFEWPGAELGEPELISEVLDRTGAWLLLDLANLYASSVNHGFDAVEAFARYPLERLAYAHVAGGVKRGALYYDTHAHPVSAALTLVTQLARRVEAPAILLERDHDFPTGVELLGELAAIESAARVEVERREVYAPPRPEQSEAGSEQLTHAQAVLARTLVSSGPIPAEWDAARIQASRELLEAKKRKDHDRGDRLRRLDRRSGRIKGVADCVRTGLRRLFVR